MTGVKLTLVGGVVGVVVIMSLCENDLLNPASLCQGPCHPCPSPRVLLTVDNRQKWGHKNPLLGQTQRPWSVNVIISRI